MLLFDIFILALFIDLLLSTIQTKLNFHIPNPIPAPLSILSHSFNRNIWIKSIFSWHYFKDENPIDIRAM